MAQISPALPIIGGNRGDGESALRSDVQALLNEFNGNIDASNLANGAVTVPKFGTLPSAKAYRSTAQTLPTGVVTVLSFDGESHDNAGLHEPVTNPGRLTASVAGVYAFSLTVSFASNATGVRNVGVRVNGSQFAAQDIRNAVNGSSTIITVSGQQILGAGQWLDAVALQTSGGNLDVDVATILPQFAMTWVGTG
jgi:hypothetical protein